jgi:hypothetical protein
MTSRAVPGSWRRRLSKIHRCFNGKAQRRPPCYVKWQVGANVNPGQSHDRDHGQREDAARRAEMGKGGGAQRDGNAGVPGQVPKPGGVAAPAPGAWKQRRRAGPAHHPLDQLRERPGTSSAGEEPAGQLSVSRQPCRRGSSRGGTKGTQLHDGTGGQVQRVGQAIDRPEHRGLTWADAVAAHGHGRNQQRRSAHPEPDARVGQHISE